MATERNVLPPPYTDEQIEKDRQEQWEELRKQFKKDKRGSEEGFMPGTYACHEAFHTASVLKDTVGRHLLEHPSIVADPVWYRHAWRAHDELYRLYREMGAGHLSLLVDEKATDAAAGKTRRRHRCRIILSEH